MKRRALVLAGLAVGVAACTPRTPRPTMAARPYEPVRVARGDAGEGALPVVESEAEADVERLDGAGGAPPLPRELDPASPLPAGVSGTAEPEVPARSIYRREAEAVALRFLSGLFAHAPRRMLADVDVVSVWAGWDRRDGLRPNPLLVQDAIMARLAAVRIEGAGAWLAMPAAERREGLRVRLYGARAIAVYSRIPGGLAIPLHRRNGRWAISRLPYRLDERPTGLPD